MNIAWNRVQSFACLASLGALALAGLAYADLVDDATGSVNGWGFTPFTQPNVADVPSGLLHVSTVANNYAPISYPSSDHLPSGGEAYDIEEMHVRFDADFMRVLVIASNGPVEGAFFLGDLFLTIDGQRWGIVTNQASQGLAAGSIYRIDDEPNETVKLQSVSGSYLNHNQLVANDYGAPAAVRDIAGPWAVKGNIDPQSLTGSAALAMESHDYGMVLGKNENDTFLIEYAIDMGALDGGPQQSFAAHIAWGCGNDVIRVHGEVPGPGSLAAIVLAVGFMPRRRRG